MRTVTTVLALAAAMAVLLARPDASGWSMVLRTVRDPGARFTIRVPETWEVHTSSGYVVIEAIAPVSAGQTPSSVDVIVRDLPAAISAESCVHQAETVMRYVIPSFRTLDESPKTIGGLPGYSHAYTWRTRDGEERRSLQVCVTLGNRAFVVIGTTGNTPVRVRRDMPTLTRIIETLHPNPFSPEPALGAGSHNQ
ncbi:MAG TPA: hypothetical protein VFW01_03265 [bacterium]|nr:hypothetical protein [bacterium]